MTSGHPRLTTEAVRRLTTSTEPWMSCDDCFDEIDRYIDSLLAGSGHGSLRLRAHLTGCGACFEEAWSLLLLAAAEQGTDPRQALTRMKNDLDCGALPWPAPPANGSQRHSS
ncbi:MAG: hypothetical protein ACRDPY_34800 [Streptosporangiaceae bacterium]